MMRLTFDINTLSEDTKAALIRARLAPTMAEASRIYMQALDAAGVTPSPAVR